MIKNNFNEKPHFPYTYGDLIENDETRVSNYIIALVQNKDFQSYSASLAYALYYLGSQAAPVGAVPPKAGEGIVNAAAQAEIGANGMVGDIQGKIELGSAAAMNKKMGGSLPNVAGNGPNVAGNGPNVAGNGAGPNFAGNGPNVAGNGAGPNFAGNGQNVFRGTQANYGGYGDFKAPPPGGGKGFPNLIPGPPTTPFWKGVNTTAVGVGIVAICLNGAWGNPFAAVVCAGALFEAAKGLVSLANR